MDNTIRLRVDLQQAISNNCKKITAHYGALLFEGEYKEYLKALPCYDSLTIRPDETKMAFDINISEDFFNSLNEEDLLKIKQNSWSYQMQDIIEQNNLNKRSALEKMQDEENVNNKMAEIIEEIENREKQYRKADEYDRNSINFVKEVLKSNLNLDTKLKETDEFLSLEINVDNITLNFKQLMLLYNIARFCVDCFFICPVYASEDLDDNKVVGIRFFWGIKLMEVL